MRQSTSASMKMNLFKSLIPLGLTLTIPLTAQAGWKRLSDSDLRTFSKNLSRHHMGAVVMSPTESLLLSSDDVDRNRSAHSLLVEDPSIGFPVGTGTSSVELKLAEIEILESLSFSNEGAVGRVTVSTAITKSAVDENRWQEISYTAFDEEKRAVSVELSGVDAKYVKIEWEVATPGKVHNFGIFGEPRAQEFELKEVGNGQQVISDNTDTHAGIASVDYNLVSVYSGARLAYVSSGSGDATALIDGDSSTSYSFDSTDEYPTVIIDLGVQQAVTRASALYDQKAAKLAFFSLTDLPESTDWVGRTSFEEQELARYRPVGLASDNGGLGRAAMDFDATEGRFVVFQFAPASSEGANFEVVDLAAFAKGVGSNHMVARSVWHAKSVDKHVEYELGEQSRSRLLSYSGPLAGFSGANYLRRGSGGLGGGGFSGRAFDRAVDEAVTRVRADLLDASDRNGSVRTETTTIERVVVNNVQGPTVFVSESTSEAAPVYAPVLQVVSRIAVSATTVEGVGHLYFNAGAGEAPPGFTFVSPAFEGTHAGGVIQPEVVGEITQSLVSESTAASNFTLPTSALPVSATTE